MCLWCDGEPMGLKSIFVNVIMAGPDWFISYFKKVPKMFPATPSADASEASFSEFNFLFNKAWMKTPALRTLNTKSIPYWTITTLNIWSVLHWPWWCCLFKVQLLSWFHTVPRKFTAVILNTFSLMRYAQDHLKFKCFQLLRDTLLGTAISGPGGMVFCSEKDGRTNKISSSFSPESSIHFCAQPSATLSICHNCIITVWSQLDSLPMFTFLFHHFSTEMLLQIIFIIVFLGFCGSWWILRFFFIAFMPQTDVKSQIWFEPDSKFWKLPFSIVLALWCSFM